MLPEAVLLLLEWCLFWLVLFFVFIWYGIDFIIKSSKVFQLYLRTLLNISMENWEIINKKQIVFNFSLYRFSWYYKNLENAFSLSGTRLRKKKSVKIGLKIIKNFETWWTRLFQANFSFLGIQTKLQGLHYSRLDTWFCTNLKSVMVTRPLFGLVLHAKA